MVTTIFVQYTDSTKATIASVFGCAQDPGVYPNQDEIPSNDGRYESYYNAVPQEMRRTLVAPGT